MALKWIERALFVIAAIFLGYYGYVVLESHLYQAYENRELDAILASAPSPGSTAVRRAPAQPRNGSLLGRLEIPRLNVSTIVRAGSDARTLQLAVGHIAGTALPGEAGNMGLAGHRDTFFRRLRDVREGDDIRFVTPEGTFRYRVEGTKVVEPTDVWVLDSTSETMLTLVTCYPFTYIGSAPHRYIVRARLEPALERAALRPAEHQTAVKRLAVQGAEQRTDLQRPAAHPVVKRAKAPAAKAPRPAVRQAENAPTTVVPWPARFHGAR